MFGGREQYDEPLRDFESALYALAKPQKRRGRVTKHMAKDMEKSIIEASRAASALDREHYRSEPNDVGPRTHHSD